jgi:hypothetical protein
MTSSLSNEYDPEKSYSPFRESYSPSRDDTQDYDPSHCEEKFDTQRHDDYDPSHEYSNANNSNRNKYDDYDPSHPNANNSNKRKYDKQRYDDYDSSYKCYENDTNFLNRKDVSNHLTQGGRMKRSQSPPAYESSRFQSKKQHGADFTAFVCNIPFTILEEELQEFFESKVKIQSFKLVDQKNEHGKLCKRFAFVSTFTEFDFQTLLSLHDTKIDNRKLCIRKSDKKNK